MAKKRISSTRCHSLLYPSPLCRYGVLPRYPAPAVGCSCSQLLALAGCRRAAPASCSRSRVDGYPAAAAATAICDTAAAPARCRYVPAVAPCAGPLEASAGLGSCHNAGRQQGSWEAADGDWRF